MIQNLLIGYIFGRHLVVRGRKEYREFCERIKARVVPLFARIASGCS